MFVFVPFVGFKLIPFLFTFSTALFTAYEINAPRIAVTAVCDRLSAISNRPRYASMYEHHTHAQALMTITITITFV
jgi:hypothetical protein